MTADATSSATAATTTASARAIWLADYLGLVKIDPAAPETWLEPNDPVTDPWDLEAIALDADRRVVWGGGYASASSSVEVRAYSFGGTLLRVISLGSDAQVFTLRLQPDDGSVWVAGVSGTSRVWRFGPDGDLRLTLPQTRSSRTIS